MKEMVTHRYADFLYLYAVTANVSYILTIHCYMHQILLVIIYMINMDVIYICNEELLFNHFVGLLILQLFLML